MTIVKTIKVTNGYQHRTHRKKRKTHYHHTPDKINAIERKLYLEKLKAEELTEE